jgi:multiple sugar transport system permease protein
MLLPYLLGLTTLFLLPSLWTLGFAFTRYDALTPPVWVGLENFARLLHDRFFGFAFVNTLIFLALTVPLRIAGALALALLCKSPGYGAPWARVAVYLPTAIPETAYALIWLVALNPQYGLVNFVLGAVGLPTPIWSFEPWPARFGLALLVVWQLGENFIILLAAARAVPASLYESSALDGAGPWARFWQITWPLLLPSLLLLTARDVMICLQANFTPSLIITKGGPGYATLFIPLYAYQLAFEDLRLGYAAAVVWTLYLITALVVVAQAWLGRRWQYEGSWL